MKRAIYRFLNRQKNKIYYSWKKDDITSHEKDIYAIVLLSLYHPTREIVGDLITQDIIISLEQLGYDIVITKTDVIITNHEFPNLGAVTVSVRDRAFEKARAELSRIRQIKKNEILTNNKNLVKEVRNKVMLSDRFARISKYKTINDDNNQK